MLQNDQCSIKTPNKAEWNTGHSGYILHIGINATQICILRIRDDVFTSVWYIDVIGKGHFLAPESPFLFI